ncbi:MAG: HAD hydrolase-like protein [Capsulimonadales bacterium]|nr:HAD hydrolase-like protein [Capsulimonadales bacterium]
MSDPLLTPGGRPPRAALFDLDGTLVRTFIDFPAMRQALGVLSERRGTTDATSGTDDILEMTERMARAHPQGERLRQEAYSILEAIEREGCAHPEAIEGATELLMGLRQRQTRVGIITRNCRAVAEELIVRMHLPCDTLIAREDMVEFKPHPEPLRVALRRFGLPASEAVMTGDLWADIAAGKAAGVRLTVGIRWPYDPPERFARCRPDVEVSSLRAAFPLLLP